MYHWLLPLAYETGRHQVPERGICTYVPLWLRRQRLWLLSGERCGRSHLQKYLVTA